MQKCGSNEGQVTNGSAYRTGIISWNQTESIKNLLHTNQALGNGMHKNNHIGYYQQNCNQGKMLAGNAIPERKHSILLYAMVMTIIFSKSPGHIYRYHG